MAELEEVDLTKALSMLGKRAPWLAYEIFLGRDTREQDIEIAQVLQRAAELLLERSEERPARERSPQVIEAGPDHRAGWGAAAGQIAAPGAHRRTDT